VAGVVVGMGATTDCAGAVRWASTEAVMRGLSLHLVHAWSEPLNLSVALSPASLPDLHDDAMSSAVHGRPVDVLLAETPELLVLGGHCNGRRLSRIARSCLRRAACPVIVVPDVVRPVTGRVIVGVSSGDTSRAALRWAADAAGRRRAHLIIVHAWQMHVRRAKDLFASAWAIPAHRDAAHDELCGWVSGVLGPVDAEMYAGHGGPLDVLLQLAADADLIVLGRGTHTGLSGLLDDALGNDLSSLVPCPIAFIHRRRPADVVDVDSGWRA
jgi:nucleotide-binding universal stress UspA family protein